MARQSSDFEVKKSRAFNETPRDGTCRMRSHMLVPLCYLIWQVGWQVTLRFRRLENGDCSRQCGRGFTRPHRRSPIQVL